MPTPVETRTRPARGACAHPVRDRSIHRRCRSTGAPAHRPPCAESCSAAARHRAAGNSRSAHPATGNPARALRTTATCGLRHPWSWHGSTPAATALAAATVAIVRRHHAGPDCRAHRSATARHRDLHTAHRRRYRAAPGACCGRSSRIPARCSAPGLPRSRTIDIRRGSGRCRARSCAGARCANSSCRWRNRASVPFRPARQPQQANTAPAAGRRRHRASAAGVCCFVVLTPGRRNCSRLFARRPPHRSSHTTRRSLAIW